MRAALAAVSSDAHGRGERPAAALVWLGLLALAVGCGRIRYEPIADAGAADGGVDPPLSRVTDLCAMALATCALIDGGSVYCWGESPAGQHGTGTGTGVVIGDDEPASMASPVELGAPAAAITCGALHACALTTGGEVYCWGDGRYGRLGYGSSENVGDDEKPSDVGPVSVGGAVQSISAGRDHTCALMAGGDVRCWGMNFEGTLGIGVAGSTAHVGDDELPSDVPVVDLGFAATELLAGARHNCVRNAAGELLCWGRGSDGELGVGSTTSIGDDEAPNGTIAPVDLAPIAHWDSEFHTCAVLTTGAVFCFGLNDTSRLGYPGLTAVGDDELPASAGMVDVGAPVAEVAAGLFHTCALLRDGGVRCWGKNTGGQLGNGGNDTFGDDEAPALSPLVDLGAFTPSTIVAGDDHTCALSADGTVICWGLNEDGELGYGHTRNVGDDEAPASEGLVPLRF